MAHTASKIWNAKPLRIELTPDAPSLLSIVYLASQRELPIPEQASQPANPQPGVKQLTPILPPLLHHTSTSRPHPSSLPGPHVKVSPQSHTRLCKETTISMTVHLRKTKSYPTISTRKAITRIPPLSASSHHKQPAIASSSKRRPAK